MKEENNVLREGTKRQITDLALTLETKEYLTLEEAAKFIGMKRATVYNYMKDLGIKTHKFKRDRRAYISLGDVKRIHEYKKNPWKVEGQS